MCKGQSHVVFHNLPVDATEWGGGSKLRKHHQQNTTVVNKKVVCDLCHQQIVGQDLPEPEHPGVQGQPPRLVHSTPGRTQMPCNGKLDATSQCWTKVLQTNAVPRRCNALLCQILQTSGVPNAAKQ